MRRRVASSTVILIKSFHSSDSPTDGTRPNSVNHEAADGVEVAIVGQLDAHRAIDLVHMGAPGRFEYVFGFLFNRLFDVLVVFVDDFTNDFFEYVFDRHQAATPPYSSSTMAM